MKDLINKIFNWLTHFGKDKYIHAWCGTLIAAAFYILLGMKVCIVPVVAAAFLKEFIDEWRYGGWDWKDFIATLIGGGFIQLFVCLPHFIG